MRTLNSPKTPGLHSPVSVYSPVNGRARTRKSVACPLAGGGEESRLPVVETFQRIVAAAAEACRAHYGPRLVSLAVFGSVARGVPRPDSDVDLLVVARELPNGRIPRIRQFDAVEEGLDSVLCEAAEVGVHTTLAAIFKTPEEVEQGSPLFLDMTEDVRILFDERDFLHGYLGRLEAKLAALGSRRVRKGGGYYWLLKPDYRPGDVIEL